MDAAQPQPSLPGFLGKQARRSFPPPHLFRKLVPPEELDAILDVACSWTPPPGWRAPSASDVDFRSPAWPRRCYDGGKSTQDSSIILMGADEYAEEAHARMQVLLRQQEEAAARQAAKEQEEAEAREKAVRDAQEQATKRKAVVEDEDLAPGTAAPSAPIAQARETSVVLLFPGQGAQTPGMFGDSLQLPAVQDLVKRYQATLGYSPLDVVFGHDYGWMQDQRITQPILFFAGMVAFEKFRSDFPEHARKVYHMAGFSLGEYAAACAAGVLSFEDGLRVVNTRGQACWKAAGNQGKGQILSVVGVERAKIEKVVEVAQQAGKKVYVSCHKFREGSNIGGVEADLNYLVPRIIGAMQTQIIGEEGAFHTPLMEPALRELDGALDSAAEGMSGPENVTLWMSAGAEPMPPGSDPEDICELLRRHLISPVQWEDTMKAIIAAGGTDFYEMSNAKMLRTFMQRIDKPAFKATKVIEL